MIALCHSAQPLSYVFKAEGLSPAALWPSHSALGKLPTTDFAEACCAQAPGDWPGLSTTWCLAPLFCLWNHVLSHACDCQVVHQSKGQVPGTVFGSQKQQFPCHHSSPVRPSYTAQRRIKLYACFHFGPQTHTSSREKKHDLLTCLPSYSPFSRRPSLRGLKKTPGPAL